MADCDWGKLKENIRGIRENTISALSHHLPELALPLPCLGGPE
ncbi:hypothetical protein PPTG_22108 [Phytophthora nicotianae INRA-310]|uniref:Uncharacterized protein n=1 Tax=Phytophthora nicotianae (strain INRA-310) TaxID=761204 RepID=W2QPF0_PHYN3|nr:hypothetical protein PPTG_22108 [Phytophthora nicotianae INRA-310]ETN14374.1 hypothetical protein PPTG_22108 [Phytophthora nicotianae INRA-310]